MRLARIIIGLALAGAIAGCDAASMGHRHAAPTSWGDRMRARTVAAVRTPTLPSAPRVASPLKDYYARQQNDLLARGKLRTDPGADVVFDQNTLVNDFLAIAMEEEYVRGQGLTRSKGGPTALAKWSDTVRIAAEFGETIPSYQSRQDRAILIDYTDRLAALTGHPIRYDEKNPNFFVFFAGQDDFDTLTTRMKEIVPGLSPATAQIFDRLPREVQCLVLAFPKEQGSAEFGRAIALVRAELPALMRRACIHEEVAQGLGLSNDSPLARPSIFNDDDEFALLTEHDALLLQMLYDPALTPGMSRSEAQPLIQALAAGLYPGTLG